MTYTLEPELPPTPTPKDYSRIHFDPSGVPATRIVGLLACQRESSLPGSAICYPSRTSLQPFLSHPFHAIDTRDLYPRLMPCAELSLIS